MIDNVAEDGKYTGHHTPAMYGFQSYISVPIILPGGYMFGTLCAIDPQPKRLSTPATIGMFKLFAELIAFHVDSRMRLNASEKRGVDQREQLRVAASELVDERARLAISEGALTDERAKLAVSEGQLLDARNTAELREQFIAVLGHDLRNPLAAIAGGTHLLARTADEEKRRTILTMMTASAKRMSDLIDNVLDFARGRLGGGITLQKESRSLQDTLAQTIDEMRSAWPDRTIETELDLPEPIDVDHARLGQVFSNLLGNAITHGAPDQPIRVVASVDDGEMQLTIANGGDAISPIALASLFEPFYRGKVRSSLQGLGLGLYISAQIAQAHGGTLSVASDKTETKFTLRIPVEQ